MEPQVALLFLASSLALIVCCTASPYYDAIVVEGRDDSEDSDSLNFDPEDCTLPPMAGPCRAGIPMYHYSTSLGKCTKFRYGGCGGNGNKFSSRNECERKCSKVISESSNSNQRPASPVSFEAAVTCVRNAASLRCGQGCFINKDRDGCMECSCGNTGTLPPPKNKDVCDLPPARGHCRALLPRWMYNPSTRSCQEFRFGGCDGNGNNFLSEAECLETCGGRRRPGSSDPDRVDHFDDEYQAAQDSAYPYTDYSSAAASIFKYVIKRFWQGA